MKQGGSQMGRLILLVLFVGGVLPALAAHRVTVGQLEQSLAADQATRRPDAVVSRQLADLELSERLTDATLSRFAARFSLGPRTALALQLLSDQSALLNPPLDELPATASPDPAVQQRMMDLARGYAVERSSHLPDFFVTRVTNRFDDSPQVLEAGSWPLRAGLHPVGTSNRQITFRDGQEVQDPTSQTTSSGETVSQEIGLHTWGEFGPALSVVLTDTAKGSISFSHWEQAPTGLVAVYRYEVPRAASHYTVRYCCQVDEHVVGRTQFGYSGRERSPQQVANIPRANDSHTYVEVPAYRGELSIDPTTGAVMRITLEADLKSGGPLMRATTMVEYGPVRIGDRSFICPVRSLALSVQEPGKIGHAGANGSGTASLANDTEWQGAVSGVNRAPVLMLNETRFTSYHRLGTTMRIVNDVAGASEPVSNSPAPGAQPAPASETPTPVPSPTAPAPGSEIAAATPPPESTAAASLPPTPAEPVIPEISMSAANTVPDVAVNATQPQEPGYSIKVTSRLVDVGVVATDKKGHPIKDLKASDFEIYDNGQKQEIRSFTEFSSPPATQTAATQTAAITPVPSPAPLEHAFNNRVAADQTPASPAAESGSTILLIDEGHIAWSDMLHAREEMLKFLVTLAPGERVGLYTITRTGFHVVEETTVDHAALAARLKSWTPASQSVLQAQDEEMRNRQQFDEVHSQADLNSVNGNQVDVPDSASTTDPLLRSMGSNPARASLVQLVGVARHLSAIPGHKSLVWVSSDNVLADWENQSVGIDKSPKMIDGFALRAQEAMNDAHVAVYPFDVSQLESGAINADIRTRNVELNQAAADTAALAGSATGSQSGGGRNMSPGRVTAAMQQDMHPIQGPVRQIATATGGRIIRRSADLAGELAGIVDDGHATYMLSFSPPGPADGQLHSITVKLNGKRNVALRYRTGYLFEKEPTTLKERFQQAIWRPMDVNEIAVSADVASDSTGVNVKVNIAAADLGLQQQADRWLDRLDIFFIQRDDEGRHAQVEGQTLGLRLKSSTYQRLMPAGVPFEHFVHMRQDRASLRVLVVDENSGRMGSITIPAPALRAGHP
jgi:VWFA-related protein